MRVLLLSNNWDVAEPVRRYLNERETVTCSSEDINGKPVRADIIVSYCYRYILRGDALKVPAVNLHNSFLPWGRGASPLLFSALYDEPCGVTIHWMDEGLDTGEIIVQSRMMLDPAWSFTQAYKEQHFTLAQLFMDWWSYIRDKAGSFHTTREVNAVKDVLGPEGWDCTIGDAKRRWRA